MRYTGRMNNSLTGCVAHRSEQGKNIFSPDTAASLSAMFSGEVSPETPRSRIKKYLEMLTNTLIGCIISTR